jgi:hypothetical protein
MKNNSSKFVLRTYEEYYKLKELRRLAVELDYQIIKEIIDDEEEISELYKKFRDSWGLTDREVILRAEKEEIIDKFEENLLDTVKRSLNVCSDIYVEEVLQVYQANCSSILFEVVTEESMLLVGTISVLKGSLGVHTILEVPEYQDREAQDAFVEYVLKQNS